MYWNCSSCEPNYSSHVYHWIPASQPCIHCLKIMLRIRTPGTKALSRGQKSVTFPCAAPQAHFIKPQYTLRSFPPFRFLPSYFSNAYSSPLCCTACSCIELCCVLTQPKPESESLCQLAFGKWKEQTCQNVGKCKTGLERRTPSLHVRHLGPKSSWHWAGSMWDPSWVCLTHSIADTVLLYYEIFLVLW